VASTWYSPTLRQPRRASADTTPAPAVGNLGGVAESDWHPTRILGADARRIRDVAFAAKPPQLRTLAEILLLWVMCDMLFPAG